MALRSWVSRPNGLRVKKESTTGKDLVIGKVILPIFFSMIRTSYDFSLLDIEPLYITRLSFRGSPTPFSKSSAYSYITKCKNRAENRQQTKNTGSYHNNLNLFKIFKNKEKYRISVHFKIEMKTVKKMTDRIVV